MRISDWSSDVCSSDLDDQRLEIVLASNARRDQPQQHRVDGPGKRHQKPVLRPGDAEGLHHGGRPIDDAVKRGEQRDVARSEEHTSELQSLMRNSYAVFCLKKKTDTNTTSQHT